MQLLNSFLIIASSNFFICSRPPAVSSLAEAATSISQSKKQISIIQLKLDTIPDFEMMMLNAGLKNIHSYDSTIKVKLVYATIDNFMRKNIYGSLQKAYLLPYVCERLAKAQKILKKLNPQLSLVIYDAARPFVCQQMLWDHAPLTESKKHLYVSHPSIKSLHNYGLAVDVAITDSNNTALDFGTPFDFFGEAAQPQKENILLQHGKLTQLQIDNRKLLRTVMIQAGFSPIKTEWWHFNTGSRKMAATKFKLIK
jgi:zinc D-Ala-D-Ala dipeptidase